MRAESLRKMRLEENERIGRGSGQNWKPEGFIIFNSTRTLSSAISNFHPSTDALVFAFALNTPTFLVLTVFVPREATVFQS